MTNTAVTTKTDNTALAAFSEFAGEGHESASANEFKLPLLSILQALSPQVQKRTGVAGAEPGMYYSDAAGLMIDGERGFEAVVCGMSHVVVEWRDRNGGNPGIENVHQAGSEVFNYTLKNFKYGERLLTTNGNALDETFYLHLLMIDGDEVVGEVLFPCSATKIAPVKAMNTKIRFASRGGAIPKYAFRLNFRTKEKKGPKGVYYVPDAAFVGGSSETAVAQPGSAIFMAAREVYQRASLAGSDVIVNSESAGSGTSEAGMDAPF